MENVRNNQTRERKRFCLNIWIILGFITTVIGIKLCFNAFVIMPELRKLEAEQAARDSIDAAAKAYADSQAVIQDSINKAVLATYKNKFAEQRDEFSGTSYISYKGNNPKYRNQNACYCYISHCGEYSYNLEFVYQYAADNWLFIDHMVFNVDGCNYTVHPSEMKSDCGYGGEIWEWRDETVDETDPADGLAYMLKAIANGGKKVKVKLIGSKYSKVRTLSALQVKSLKETYEYYIARKAAAKI